MRPLPNRRDRQKVSMSLSFATAACLKERAIRNMGTLPIQYRKAVNRLVWVFSIRFCRDGDSADWASCSILVINGESGGIYMKYAIDRFIMGLEKEVCADDFDGKLIPRKSNRFYCPECGLQVYWVSKGGNQPNKFKHPPRTETSPECDKRVDGRSSLYLYERVGLPVFLTRPSESSFQLAISFPAVGSKMLASGAAQNARVIIRGNETTRTVPIDVYNFYPDRATLVPVNFLPSDNGVFRIGVSPGSVYSRKWSDYAEGFTSTGAIFTYDEAGGKKVHRDDSISPGRQYYVVARQFSCPFREIHYNAVGTLNLLNGSYQVYCMTVNVSLQNEQRYSEISDFFRYRFGVGLLETAPEIVPLWPPVIERDVLIPAKNSPVFCAVTSGNEDPSVYSYVGNQVFSIPVQQDQSGEKHIYVKVGATDTILSVDRKYVGREIVFCAKDMNPGTSCYDFLLMGPDGTAIAMDEMDRNAFSHGGSVSVNAKMELFLGSLAHNYVHIPLRTGNTLLPAFQNLHEILMLVDGGVIYSHRLRAHSKQPGVGGRGMVISPNAYRGEYVPVPRWAFHLLEMLRINGSHTIAQEVIPHIVNGKLPIGVIVALEELQDMVRRSSR